MDSKITPKGQLVSIRNPFLQYKPSLAEQKFEFIFMMDVSTSMKGRKLELAKDALLLFLQSLPQDCYYNVVTFRTSYKKFFETSVKNSSASLEIAKMKAKELHTHMGFFAGTNLLKPLYHIYSQQQVKGYLTQIFTITDGQVENRNEVLDLIAKHVTHSRSFSLGIGDKVDKTLVKGIAENGGGTHAFAETNEKLASKIIDQLKIATKPALLKPIRVLPETNLINFL